MLKVFFVIALSVSTNAIASNNPLHVIAKCEGHVGQQPVITFLTRELSAGNFIYRRHSANSDQLYPPTYPPTRENGKVVDLWRSDFDDSFKPGGSSITIFWRYYYPSYQEYNNIKGYFDDATSWRGYAENDSALNNSQCKVDLTVLKDVKRVP
jgi:hypothetical protein